LKKLDPKTWVTATHRPPKEAWRLNHFVYTPMDMGIISEKAAAAKYELICYIICSLQNVSSISYVSPFACRYTSLEEFQVDCETLVHAIGCFFGSDLLKGVGIGAAFIRDVIHDINVRWLCKVNI